MQNQDANSTMVYLTAISIGAIILGPILAVQTEKFLSRINEKKKSREYIFKSLMATRGSILSFDHVAALNRIDLEFPETKKFKPVLSAWKYYFDNLSNNAKKEANLQIWVNDNDKLLIELLFEMGKSLGYSFDKALIQRNIYSPVGHAKTENELQEIRFLLLELLKGKTPLPMNIVATDKSGEEEENNQVKLQKIMIDYYTNMKPIKVIIERENENKS